MQRDMNCVEKLKSEHRLILTFLEPIPAICNSLASEQGADLGPLEKFLEFGNMYVADCHFKKEELSLFPLLEKMGVPIRGGPPELALKDHLRAERQLDLLSFASKQYKSGNLAASEVICQTLNFYKNLVTEHIRKEERILYPTANQLLSLRKHRCLFEDFKKIEAQTLGETTSAALCQIPWELNKYYKLNAPGTC